MVGGWYTTEVQWLVSEFQCKESYTRYTVWEQHDPTGPAERSRCSYTADGTQVSVVLVATIVMIWSSSKGAISSSGRTRTLDLVHILAGEAAPALCNCTLTGVYQRCLLTVWARPVKAPFDLNVIVLVCGVPWRLWAKLPSTDIIVSVWPPLRHLLT